MPPHDWFPPEFIESGQGPSQSEPFSTRQCRWWQPVSHHARTRTLRILFITFRDSNLGPRDVRSPNRLANIPMCIGTLCSLFSVCYRKSYNRQLRDNEQFEHGLWVNYTAVWTRGHWQWWRNHHSDDHSTTRSIRDFFFLSASGPLSHISSPTLNHCSKAALENAQISGWGYHRSVCGVYIWINVCSLLFVFFSVLYTFVKYFLNYLFYIVVKRTDGLGFHVSIFRAACYPSKLMIC